MERTRRILMAEMLACIIISLVVVLLFETDTLLPGYYAGDTGASFLSLTVMIILTLGLIPLSLKLFKLKAVSSSLASFRERALLKWGSVRMMMVCLPMVANIVLYYLFDLIPGFFYMSVICLVCLIFIYPGKSRCLSETGSAE